MANVGPTWETGPAEMSPPVVAAADRLSTVEAELSGPLRPRRAHSAVVGMALLGALRGTVWLHGVPSNRLTPADALRGTDPELEPILDVLDVHNAFDELYRTGALGRTVQEVAGSPRA
jgi:hypothetical protein